MDSNSDEFIPVKHKKGRKFKNPRLGQNNRNVDNFQVEESDLDIPAKTDALKNKILLSSEEMRSGDFFVHFKELINKSIEHWTKETPTELVVYGLGNFSSSLIARQQLDLALALREELSITDENCFCYDPIFTRTEIKLLKDFGWNVPDKNEEGKRRRKNQCVYYLPHCGKSLYNNILWSNWCLQDLSNIIIIGNSFTAMVERSPKRVLEKCGNYILKIQPFTTELPFPNKYHNHQDVFNDTSIHVFKTSELNPLSDVFWIDPAVPQYSEEDSDFISAHQSIDHKMA